MTTVRERRLEQERVRMLSRERAKRAKAPVYVDIPIEDVVTQGQFEYLGIPRSQLRVMLSEAYAPILKTTGDERLIEIAEKYKLPLSQEQRFLLETGDVFLEQYQKQQIPEEEQMELLGLGFNPLVSSNLKAVRVVDDNLQILFHSDAIYEYPNQANMYYPFSEALSPGRLLWRTIRTVRGYRRIA